MGNTASQHEPLAGRSSRRASASSAIFHSNSSRLKDQALSQPSSASRTPKILRSLDYTDHHHNRQSESSVQHHDARDSHERRSSFGIPTLFGKRLSVDLETGTSHFMSQKKGSPDLEAKAPRKTGGHSRRQSRTATADSSVDTSLEILPGGRRHRLMQEDSRELIAMETGIAAETPASCPPPPTQSNNHSQPQNSHYHYQSHVEHGILHQLHHNHHQHHSGVDHHIRFQAPTYNQPNHTSHQMNRHSLEQQRHLEQQGVQQKAPNHHRDKQSHTPKKTRTEGSGPHSPNVPKVTVKNPSKAFDKLHEQSAQQSDVDCNIAESKAEPGGIHTIARNDEGKNMMGHHHPPMPASDSEFVKSVIQAYEADAEDVLLPEGTRRSRSSTSPHRTAEDDDQSIMTLELGTQQNCIELPPTSGHNVLTTLHPATSTSPAAANVNIAPNQPHMQNLEENLSSAHNNETAFGASTTAFLNPRPQTVKESMAALAAAAKAKRLKAMKFHDAAASAAARTSVLDANRRGERIGGSVVADPVRPRLRKFNSCSTLFIETTMSHADLSQTLKCVSIALVNSIRRNNESPGVKMDDIFSEKLHPLSRHIQFYHNTPSEDEVFKFLECLFQAADLNVECAVITMIYIERMLVNTGVGLMTINWARIVLGGLLLASKVWDDHAVWNIDFCQIFPDVDVKDMNELERWYMSAIEYNVSIKASLYARYYFELRDLAETQVRPWTLKPLTIADASKLEAGSLVGRQQQRSIPAPLQDDLKEPNGPNSAIKVMSNNAKFSNNHLGTNDGAMQHLTIERGMKKSHSDFVFVPPSLPASIQ